MTPLQKQIYNMIKKHWKKHQCAQSARTIAGEIGVSRQHIDNQINILVALGKLKKPKKGVVLLVE